MAKIYQCDKCGQLIEGQEDTVIHYLARAGIICGLMYLWSIGKLGWWWLVIFLL